SDLNMPGMNGIELTRALIGRDALSSVVLMSTEISAELDAEARDAGAMAFLKKPFSNEDVDAILHHAFGLPHAKFSKAVKLFAGA
ncbi:response regulator, partial [Acinetobacter baumannii]